MGRSRELAELAASYDSGNLFGMKNRIINGAMVVNQRALGTVNPINTDGLKYTIDRWWAYNSNASSKFSLQQSTDAPAGFSNSLLVTSSSAYSIGSSEEFDIGQYVEGFNFADMAWGTASAKAVTLSFWVKSSLTGTFGGSLMNNAYNRSYPFTYAINSANTWEQKTITVSGDTTGTWIGSTNGIGLRVIFGLGVGSVKSGTAGSWAAAEYESATGAVSLVGTNGATFYITGVQLEKGSTATSFDYRPYGTELALCQRYYERQTASGVYTGFASGTAAGTASSEGVLRYTTKRSAPTISGSTLALSDGANAPVAVTSLGSGYRGSDSALYQANVASGLTQYRPYSLISNNSASGYIDLSAEL